MYEGVCDGVGEAEDGWGGLAEGVFAEALLGLLAAALYSSNVSEPPFSDSVGNLGRHAIAEAADLGCQFPSGTLARREQ